MKKRLLIELALARRQKWPVKLPRIVYAAAYGSVEAAMADLDAIEQLHKDEMIGQYDAAVIDKEEANLTL